MQPRDGHRYFVLVCGLFETVTVTGARLYVLAVIEHAKAAKILVMDLEDAGSRARFLIRDRDGKFPGLFDAVLRTPASRSCSGVQMPRMNALILLRRAVSYIPDGLGGDAAGVLDRNPVALFGL